jgi:hypothetical protein
MLFTVPGARFMRLNSIPATIDRWNPRSVQK